MRKCDESGSAPPPRFSYGAGAPNAKRLWPNPNSDHNHNRKAINRFCNVPEEVVEEILLRVPADSLKNCKRVCKSWFDMIDHPSFVNKHLVRVSAESKKMNSKSFFLKWIREDEDIDTPHSPLYDHHHANDLSKLELSLVTISEEEEEEEEEEGDADGNTDHLPCVIERVTLPPVPAVADQQHKPFPSDLRVSHCDGIIHMFDHYKDWTALLLNPALAQFKLLQEPPEPPLEFDTFIGCGFGHDFKLGAYKYVKIFGRDFYSDPVALVYTLGTSTSTSSNSWRKIDINVEGNYLFLIPKGVYCRGAYYWLNEPSAKVATILSFDFSQDKFHIIPLPLQQPRSIHNFILLQLWNDSLVLLSSTESSRSSTCFDMWVMVNNCWTKHLNIGPLANIMRPVAFWKLDELLLDTRDGRVVSYNLCTKRLRTVPLPGAVFAGCTSASPHFKSLVSV